MPNLLKLLLLKYEWRINLDLNVESVKRVLERAFNEHKHFNGIVNHRSFSFMYNPILLRIYNANLVGFYGKIHESGTNSYINVYCRFGKPFIYIYWIAGFSSSIGYLFNIGNQEPLLKYTPDRLWIALLFPVLVYILVFLFYIVELKIGREAIHMVFKQIRKDEYTL